MAEKAGIGEELSVAILAGGSSRRMGRDKALALLAGKPVIVHLIENLSGLGKDTFIAGGDAGALGRFGLPVYPDRFQLRASLVGIHTALSAARNRWCLVTACDTPFVGPELVELMARQAPGHDAVIPRSHSGTEPLPALYCKTCLDEMKRNIEGGDLRILDSLKRLDVRFLTLSEVESFCDPDRVFFNVNTPEALERAGEMAATVERPPLVCFVGRKNSGKTTLIERLVPRLRQAGQEVAFIKHDVHGFSMDHEGTDTWRIARAGARQVIISGPGALAEVSRREREMTLAELRRRIGPQVDIILAEGFKSAGGDRIEVSRSERSRELVQSEDELMAVVSDRPDAAASVPVFGMDDIEGIVNFLFERCRLRPAPEGAEGDAPAPEGETGGVT
jgi:molybdopterin-guanine dinucleotide biosynthesis protein MobB